MVNGIFVSLGKTQKVSISSSSARNATNLVSDKLMIWSTADCYLAFGDESVTASTTTGIGIPAGIPLFVHNPGTTRIAVIAESGVTGTLFITECA